METAIKVFMILSTVVAGIATLGIALLWCIPMTVHYCKNTYFVGTGFKICTLLFVNTIAGILMLCDNQLKESKFSKKVDTLKNQKAPQIAVLFKL